MECMDIVGMHGYEQPMDRYSNKFGELYRNYWLMHHIILDNFLSTHTLLLFAESACLNVERDLCAK